MKATILRAGPSDSIQDFGRTGYRALGVSSGGALDSFAAAVTNVLAGNPVDAAVIEITLGNFRLRCSDDRLVAWSGGDFAVRCGGERLAAGHAGALAAGEEIEFARANHGCRAWLALSGGIDLPLLLGSRSTDLRAGFGGMDGRALRNDDAVALGETTPAVRARWRSIRQGGASALSPPNEWVQTAASFPTLRIVRGADWEMFTATARRAFFGQPYVVTPAADRMGIRLEGPPLRRKGKGDLLSEAVAPGAIQVPPNGQPILLLGDCQTIGGYPKIAHVITVDLPRAAQLRPGDEVRFVETSLDDAQALLTQRALDFDLFRVGLELLAK